MTKDKMSKTAKINISRCPNCGRNLTESEMYCYFCERNVQELKIKNKKNSKIKNF